LWSEGTGDELRDFLYVSGLAKGCLLAIENHATADPIDMGYGQSITIKGIVHHILSVAGYGDAEVVFDSSKRQGSAK
jgi:GDP-L-fucose synthase